MTTTRINPYTALRDECREWARSVLRPQTREMWTYSADQMKEGYALTTLHARVAAADQLGWDVRLRARPNGDLFVEYVNRPPGAPWAIRMY